MARKKDFDWLDDPFDEKKAAHEQVQAATSTGTKMALGCGCLFVVAALIGLFIFVGMGVMDLLSQ